MQTNQSSERGITLIALLIMIIILVIITAVVIRNITGDEPLIGITAEAAEDYKVESYREEISHTVHSEIIAKSAIGETATTGDIADKLNDQDWIKTAYVNADATSEVGNITAQVNEGYIYQIYYNSIYGKIEIDYIGKDKDPEDINSLTLTARYEKSPASIFATAEDKKKGIAKLELVYKDQVVMTKDKPTGEQKFDISEIGTGWYKVKATSNSGAVKYEWVKAINISDKLTIPQITIETESIVKNGWYGADQKEVWIKISTTSPSAKEIIYNLTGATIKGETIEKLPEVQEGEEKSIRIKIENCGPTNIMAVTSDGVGYESEPNGETVKYDNLAPRITTSTAKEVQGTVGQNSWYTSEEVKITVEAEDPPAGILDGYTYRITNETTKQTTETIHQKDITKQITIKEDGEYTIYIQAIDQAGNTSPTRTIPIKKDSTKPTVETPQISSITETTFTVTVAHGDTTSGIAYFEYYLNGTKVATQNTATWTPTNLTPNQTYNVSVIAYDQAGNPSIQSSTVPAITKGQLLPPNINISGNTRNGYYIGTVTITVSDTSDSTKTRVSKIKVTGAGAERTITGTSGSFTITSDGTYTISAWGEDASGNRSSITTKPAFKRDATVPKPTLGTPTTNSNGTIKVTATANETGGSGVKSYEFQYKQAGGSWTRKQLITSTASSYTYTYTGMGDGKTVYIRVIVTDGAGNIGKSAADNANGTSAVIPIKNTAPVVQTITYKSKTTNSITVTAKATDAQNDKLTYTLYTSTNNSTWTQKATSSSVSSGTEVTLTASGLSQYTYYYVKIRATETTSRKTI